ENEKWTTHYFELPGLNVPGVTTISGKPMGGWIQYSMSPTTSAWLAHHFYLQSVYSMDKKMAQKADSYLSDVYMFIESFLSKNNTDTAFIPLSSTPEYNNNSIKAWFKETTNYDKALMLSLRPEIMRIKEVIYKELSPIFCVNDGVDRMGSY